MRMRIRNINVESLIGLVEKNNILYDRQHPFFRSIMHRELIWKEISQVLNVESSCERLEHLTVAAGTVELSAETNDERVGSQAVAKMKRTASSHGKRKRKEKRQILFDLVDIEALLEAIEKQPMLYNPKDHNYRDLALKEAAWEYVADQLECTVELAKMKFKSCRSAYNKYLRHVAECKIARKKYKVWRYAPMMRFLRPYTMKVIIDDVTDSTDDELAYYDSTTPKTKNTDLKPSSNLDEDIFEISDNDDDLGEDELDEASAISDNQPTSTTEHLVSTTSCNTPGFTLDADDLIFLGYARTIKKLRPDKRSMAKFRIAEVIMNVEMESNDESVGNGRTRRSLRK